MDSERKPRGYQVLGLTTEPRKCLLCGHRGYCHTMIKTGVRHYVHARCAVDNDPAIVNRMPHWILCQMPLSAFEGQSRAFFNEIMRRVRA